MDNFEVHLKNRQHKERVERRLKEAKEGAATPAMTTGATASTTNIIANASVAADMSDSTTQVGAGANANANANTTAGAPS